MERHMTVSGFIVHEERVALHWHRKLQKWLPAGGHIEAGEDTLSAVLREVREEFALEAEVIPTARRAQYSGGPRQVEPPHSVLEYEVEPGHWHVDYVYMLRCTAGHPGRCHDAENPIRWLDIEALERGSAEQGGVEQAFAPDIQALGIEAIRLAGAMEPAGAGQRG